MNTPTGPGDHRPASQEPADSSESSRLSAPVAGSDFGRVGCLGFQVRIEAIWKTQADDQVMIAGRWYLRPEETCNGRQVCSAWPYQQCRSWNF